MELWDDMPPVLVSIPAIMPCDHVTVVVTNHMIVVINVDPTTVVTSDMKSELLRVGVAGSCGNCHGYNCEQPSVFL